MAPEHWEHDAPMSNFDIGVGPGTVTRWAASRASNAARKASRMSLSF